MFQTLPRSVPLIAHLPDQLPGSIVWQCFLFGGKERAGGWRTRRASAELSIFRRHCWYLYFHLAMKNPCPRHPALQDHALTFPILILQFTSFIWINFERNYNLLSKSRLRLGTRRSIPLDFYSDS